MDHLGVLKLHVSLGLEGKQSGPIWTLLGGCKFFALSVMFGTLHAALGMQHHLYACQFYFETSVAAFPIWCFCTSQLWGLLVTADVLLLDSL